MQFRLRTLLPPDRRIAWIWTAAALAALGGVLVQLRLLTFGPPPQSSYVIAGVMTVAGLTIWALSPRSDLNQGAQPPGAR